MLKKSCVVIFCVLVCAVNAISFPCLAAMSSASNQNSNLLSMNGRIVDGEITDEGPNEVKVTLKLSLDVKNVGFKNALILMRKPVVVERKIIAHPEDAKDDKYLYRLQTWPSIARSPEWEELQQRINKPSPPPDVIRELAPNETWELETTIWFYIGKKTNLDPDSKSWRVIHQASPVWLQVTLEMWSSDIEPNPDREELKFSRMLQRRWQRAGELQLESLTSEPMPLDLQSLILSDTARQRK